LDEVDEFVLKMGVVLGFVDYDDLDFGDGVGA